MKTALIAVTLLVFLFTPVMAGINIELETSKYATTSAVTCSSSTATALYTASGWLTSVYLIPAATTYTIYIATYAATATTNLYPLKNREFKVDGSPYSGILYGLSQAGQSLEMRVLKLWRR